VLPQGQSGISLRGDEVSSLKFLFPKHFFTENTISFLIEENIEIVFFCYYLPVFYFKERLKIKVAQTYCGCLCPVITSGPLNYG